MQKTRACLSSLLILLALSACGSADYKPPVSAFAAAAKAATASLEAHQAALDAAALEENITFALGKPEALLVKDRECIAGSKRCRLEIALSGTERTSFVPDPIAVNIGRLMAEVVTYSANLEAIAVANTDTEVKAAADSTKGHLISLGKAIDEHNALPGRRPSTFETSATALGAPVADAVVYLAGKYVEAVKLVAVRKSTGAMKVIFPDLTKVFGAVADAGAADHRHRLRDHYVKAMRVFRSGPPTRERLEELRAATAAYDAALTTDASAVFTGLESAHGALAEALQRPAPTFETLWPLIEQVIKETEKVQALVSALRKAAAPAAKA